MKRLYAIVGLSFLLSISCTKASKSKGASGPAPATGTAAGTQTDKLAIDPSTTVPLDAKNLRIANGVSLVSPKTTGNLPSSQPGSLAVQANTASLDAGTTDFDTDEISAYVDDASMTSLDFASSLLCLVGQSGYLGNINKGAFVALVDEPKCFNKGKARGEKGSSSGSEKKAARLVRMTVDVKRDDKKPLVVDFWVDVPAKTGRSLDDAQTTLSLSARATIMKGATKINPFGIFRMSYKAAAKDSQSDPVKGTLEITESEAGKVFLKLFDTDSYENRAAAAVLDFDVKTQENTGGKAVSKVWNAKDDKDVWDNYAIAFDPHKYHATSDGSDPRCLDRDGYMINVWRYGVYDQTTGARVVGADTDIPLHRTIAGQTDPDNGDIGSWGVGFDNSTPIKDGDTIYADSLSHPDAAPVAYTAHVSPGKLLSSTDKAIDVAQAKAMRLLTWDGAANHNIVVQWSDALPGFQKVADYVDPTDKADGYYKPVSPPVPFKDLVRSMRFGEEDGPDVSLTLDTDKPDILSAALRIDAQEHPTSDLTLWCSFVCPKPGLTEADYAAGNTTLPDATSTADMKQYIYKASTKTLMYQGQPVTLAFTQASGDSAYVNGGSMVTDDYHQAHKSADDYYWNLDSAPVVYSWSFGSDNESHDVQLVDGNGTALTLKPPLAFDYVHSKDNDILGKDASPTYGQKFLLDVTEAGDITGIPGAAAADGAYVPLFSIRTGTKLGASDKIKALDIEERMPDLGAGACTDLTMDGLPALPSVADVIDVDIGKIPDAHLSASHLR